ncbi:MAG: hypothetical protein QOD95_2073 [Gammaproteobacteria bacterium]|jgi:hypothetical protein|nr:hypothetical protein [Gammaproteobacteria bacterium]
MEVATMARVFLDVGRLVTGFFPYSSGCTGLKTGVSKKRLTNTA